MSPERETMVYLTCFRCSAPTCWLRREWWDPTTRRTMLAGSGPGACTCGSKLWTVDINATFKRAS